LGKLVAGQHYSGKFIIQDARASSSKRPFKVIANCPFIRVDSVKRMGDSENKAPHNTSSESYSVEYTISAPNRSEDILGEIIVKTIKDEEIFRLPVSGL
jgi:hypothetical protein